MFASSWLRQLQRRWFGLRAVRRVPVRRRVRLCLEALEERQTPSTYTVTDASDTAGSASDVTLRYSITQAVSNQDQNAVINFSSALAGQTITLKLTDSNTSYGPTAFVVNKAKITIDGSNAPGLVLNGNNSLRPFAVTNTASLTLENLTVEGGLAQGGVGGSRSGGGGGVSGGGRGLGVAGSSGPDGGTGVSTGGHGGSFASAGGAGGFGGGGGMGGGLFANGGSLTLINDTFTANTAQGGGSGGNRGGGSGYGGAVFALNSTLTATFDSFSGNTAAQGGTDVYILSDGSSTDGSGSNGSGSKAATAALVDDILGQTSNTVSDFVANSINSGAAPNLNGSSNDLVRNNLTDGTPA